MSLRRGLLASLRAAGRRLVARGGTGRGEADFRLAYQRFREVLTLNDSILNLVADLEEAAAGRLTLDPSTVAARLRKGAMDAFVMAKDLNQLSGQRYPALYEVVSKLAGALDAELAGVDLAIEGALVLPLGKAAAAPQLVGAKMAALAEAAAACGVRVPPGFVITTVATDRFLRAGGLWQRCERLETVLELHGEEALEEVCEEVQRTILATPIPEPVAAAVAEALAGTDADKGARFAVRSSAVGEDTSGLSHAGVYRSELGVSRRAVLDA